ncbi:hypothetical protein AK88_05658 [Plasmodium fragile]|uniref:Uncharacterized protein n=1 Tax=Plasmodium fragile TaxID=5857 RepID=A0A0D9QCE2_PLAFR|nr:uncharacterized protein AK88_05658 [Plasmodium fragile]KJP84710.1 hypothetical protein AK88_05658 [Plasmodium fragile]
MAHLNTISTSNVSQGTWQCRNGKTVDTSRKGNETHGTRAHVSLFFKKCAILFAVACIFLRHTDDVETQEEHVAKVQVYNRGARRLAKGSAAPSEDELELDPMVFEHYDGAYDDVEQPYEEDYACSPKRIYSDGQWEDEEDGTILKERKVVEYEIPQQVHYYGKWKIEHDAREEEVDNGDTLSADVAVAASVNKSRTSVSKVGEDGSLPPSKQNDKNSGKTKQEPKGSSDTGTSASTGSIGSTKNGKQNDAVKMKPGRDFSRRKLATYIIYRYSKFFVAAIVIYSIIMLAIGCMLALASAGIIQIVSAATFNTLATSCGLSASIWCAAGIALAAAAGGMGIGTKEKVPKKVLKHKISSEVPQNPEVLHKNQRYRSNRRHLTNHK